eukprot:scaffold1991_cov111-Isochrysis_galbana.AAC.12
MISSFSFCVVCAHFIIFQYVAATRCLEALLHSSGSLRLLRVRFRAAASNWSCRWRRRAVSSTSSAIRLILSNATAECMPQYCERWCSFHVKAGLDSPCMMRAMVLPESLACILPGLGAAASCAETRLIRSPRKRPSPPTGVLRLSGSGQVDTSAESGPKYAASFGPMGWPEARDQRSEAEASSLASWSSSILCILSQSNTASARSSAAVGEWRTRTYSATSSSSKRRMDAACTVATVAHPGRLEHHGNERALLAHDVRGLAVEAEGGGPANLGQRLEQRPLRSHGMRACESAARCGTGRVRRLAGCHESSRVESVPVDGAAPVVVVRAHRVCTPCGVGDLGEQRKGRLNNLAPHIELLLEVCDRELAIAIVRILEQFAQHGQHLIHFDARVAHRALPVPPRPAGLLYPVLNGARQSHVRHHADVRLVDAHPEGHCRHHHSHLTGGEVGVYSPALRRRPTRVVVLRLPAVAAEGIGDALRLRLGASVDNGASALRQAADAPSCTGPDRRACPTDHLALPRRQRVAQNLEEPSQPAGARHDLGVELEVRPLLIDAEHAIGRDAEVGGDGARGAHGGCGGQRQDGLHSERVERRADRHVGRPEVVRPLGEAVRLVHARKADSRKRGRTAPGAGAAHAADSALGRGQLRGDPSGSAAAAGDRRERAQHVLEGVICQALWGDEEHSGRCCATGVAAPERRVRGPALVHLLLRREEDAAEGRRKRSDLVGDEREQW